MSWWQCEGGPWPTWDWQGCSDWSWGGGRQRGEGRHSDAAAVVPKAGLTATGSAGDGQRGAKRQRGSHLGWAASSAAAASATDADKFFAELQPWARWKCSIYPSEAFKAVSTKWWKTQAERLEAAGAKLGRRNKRHHGDGKVIPKEINVRGNNAQELLHSVIDALLTDHPDIQIESVEFEELDTEETGCVPAADNSIAWGCPPQVASSAPPARPLRQRDPVGVIVTSTSWTSRPAY